MAADFTKIMIIILVLWNMSTIKADLKYAKIKKPQLTSSVRHDQESLTHETFGVTNNTIINQKLWLNMKQMLAQLNMKQMSPQSCLKHLILLRDSIKTKKLQQELRENSSKNGATNVRKIYDKNRGTTMKSIGISDKVNGSMVVPSGINIPNAESQQLNIYLKFLDRIIRNKINLMNNVFKKNFLNMTTQSAPVDENAEKAEILEFISRNSVNATKQNTKLDEDSEKVAILKLISGNQKTDLSKEPSGDFVEQKSVELSNNLKEQNLATAKSIDELNSEVIRTIETYQNDGDLNQNTSHDNEITHLNKNTTSEEIITENTTVEGFSLSGNISKLENHVSNGNTSDEELMTRRRQKSDPHRHPTERDLSKHSLDKGLPNQNKGNGRHRDREGHFSKYRSGVNHLEMYGDDGNEYNIGDPLDPLAVPLGESEEGKLIPVKDENSCMGLMEILILIMICIIATQFCILALLFILKDKLIMNLTFKYGQIKV